MPVPPVRRAALTRSLSHSTATTSRTTSLVDATAETTAPDAFDEALNEALDIQLFDLDLPLATVLAPTRRPPLASSPRPSPQATPTTTTSRPPPPDAFDVALDDGLDYALLDLGVPTAVTASNHHPQVVTALHTPLSRLVHSSHLMDDSLAEGGEERVDEEESYSSDTEDAAAEAQYGAEEGDEGWFDDTDEFEDDIFPVDLDDFPDHDNDYYDNDLPDMDDDDIDASLPHSGTPTLSVGDSYLMDAITTAPVAADLPDDEENCGTPLLPHSEPRTPRSADSWCEGLDACHDASDRANSSTQPMYDSTNKSDRSSRIGDLPQTSVVLPVAIKDGERPSCLVAESLSNLRSRRARLITLHPPRGNYVVSLLPQQTNVHF